MGYQFTLADDALQLRVAPSPLHELSAMLRLCVLDQPHPSLGALPADLSSTLADEDVALCAALSSTADYVPDFLTPVPDSGESVADLLDRVDAAPRTEVTWQMRKASCELTPEVFRVITRTEPHRLAARIARGMWRFNNAIDESFATALERTNRAFEDHYRRTTDRAATDGLGELHDKMSVHGTTLVVGEAQELYDCQCVESIVVSSTSNVGLRMQPEGGRLWIGIPEEGQPPPPPAEAARGSRRRVLDAITHPMTTQQLSRQLDLSPATISYHLGNAVRSGLLRKQRHGRIVLYTPA